jgi:hypothetical protein
LCLEKRGNQTYREGLGSEAKVFVSLCREIFENFCLGSLIAPFFLAQDAVEQAQGASYAPSFHELYLGAWDAPYGYRTLRVRAGIPPRSVGTIKKGLAQYYEQANPLNPSIPVLDLINKYRD